MEPPPSDNLYMKGLPSGITEDQLKSIFGSYGTVMSVRLLPAPAGLTDAAALVRMSSAEEAQWVVENASTIAGVVDMPIQVRFAVNSQAAGKGTGAHPPPAPAPLPAPVMTPLQTARPQHAGPPSSKLYIRGLPIGISEEHLNAIMSAYGTVLSCKVLPPLAGASDAASIVQMANTEQAQWMVDMLNGNIPQGLSTPVVVKFKSEGPASQHASQGFVPAAPATSTTAFLGMSASAHAQNGQPSDNLYMCGFPIGTPEETLKTVFGAYGTVLSCKVLPPPPGKSDVACLMRMGSVEEAQWLVEHVNGNIPQGMTGPITIRYADKSRTLLGGLPHAAVAPPPPPVLPVMTYHSAAHSQGPAPSSNLYMKGFPANTTEAMLRSVFGQYGVVVSCKVMPTISGGNDVAALVQMSDVVEAQWLVDNVNGNIPQGFAVPIQIRFAHNQKGGGKGNSLANANGPDKLGIKWPPKAGAAHLASPPMTAGQPSESLYIQGFPLGETEETVRRAIGQYGMVMACKRLTLPPGHGSSAWLVQMSNLEESTWLVDNLHENIPTGYTTPVDVKFYPNFAAGPVAGASRYSPY